MRNIMRILRATLKRNFQTYCRNTNNFKIMASRANDIALLTSSSLLVFLIFAGTFQAILIASTQDSLPYISVLISIMLSAAYLCIVSKCRMDVAVSIIAAVLVQTASLALSSIYFDISSDGTAYHQEAIMQINKVFQFTKGEFTGPYNLFTNSYPKFSWLYSSAISDNVHLGKSLNFLLICCSFLVALVFFKNLSLISRVWISILISCNPIALAQIYTHYVDGALGSFLTIALLGVYGILTRQYLKFSYLFLIAGSVGCASLKHTGLVFSFLCIFLALIFVKNYWQLHKQFINYKVIGPMILAGLLLCFNPYVKNLLDGKHLFHPSMGADRVETLISGQTTPEFYNLNRFSKLFLSIFGKTENTIQSTTSPYPTLKMPFTVSRSEIQYLRGTDVRWGGWGPLFGGVFLSILAYFTFRFRKIKEYGIFLGLLFTLSVINPESWWARFNPQLYTSVIFVLAFILQKDKVFRPAAIATMVVLSLNSALVFTMTLKNIQAGSSYVKTALAKINHKNQPNVCWTIKTMHLEPIFDHLGIDWNANNTCGSSCTEVFSELVCNQEDQIY